MVGYETEAHFKKNVLKLLHDQSVPVQSNLHNIISDLTQHYHAGGVGLFLYMYLVNNRNLTKSIVLSDIQSELLSSQVYYGSCITQSLIEYYILSRLGITCELQLQNCTPEHYGKGYIHPYWRKLQNIMMVSKYLQPSTLLHTPTRM